MKDIIFVRKEESSFTTLVSVLTKRTQWFKLHEQSINITTINDNETNNEDTLFTDQTYFPFRVSDLF